MEDRHAGSVDRSAAKDRHAAARADLDALEALVFACESEFGGPGTDNFKDDDDVMSPPSGITFGMIRRARAALETTMPEPYLCETHGVVVYEGCCPDCRAEELPSSAPSARGLTVRPIDIVLLLFLAGALFFVVVVILGLVNGFPVKL